MYVNIRIMTAGAETKRVRLETIVPLYDLAVKEYRAALADPNPDPQSLLKLLDSCESFAPQEFNYRLGRESIEVGKLWELRGLTFEGEVAALRANDRVTADLFVGERQSYEDILLSCDPEKLPEIESLPRFNAQHQE